MAATPVINVALRSGTGKEMDYIDDLLRLSIDDAEDLIAALVVPREKRRAVASTPQESPRASTLRPWRGARHFYVLTGQ